MEQKRIVHSAEETKQLARILSRLVQPGDVLLLEGELGAGKTTFAKGFAEGLDITDVIKSPTYTLMRAYESGRLPFYHFDVYRLEESGGGDLGFEEYIDGEGVSLIEWSRYIEDSLPETYLEIELKRTGEADDDRQLTVKAVGNYYASIATKWEELWSE